MRLSNPPACCMLGTYPAMSQCFVDPSYFQAQSIQLLLSVSTLRQHARRQFEHTNALGKTLHHQSSKLLPTCILVWFELLNLSSPRTALRLAFLQAKPCNKLLVVYLTVVVRINFIEYFRQVLAANAQHGCVTSCQEFAKFYTTNCAIAIQVNALEDLFQLLLHSCCQFLLLLPSSRSLLSLGVHGELSKEGHQTLGAVFHSCRHRHHPPSRGAWSWSLWAECVGAASDDI
mmetsp:Transcript_18881/g.34142  ORF Transcript_18881/g.34142 Transcript_18881/m.34142 type:complete len:231 (-) Transcript_18881:2-694(-)